MNNDKFGNISSSLLEENYIYKIITFQMLSEKTIDN